MKKNVKGFLFGLLGITLAISSNAQCPVINCPSDIVVNNNSGGCEMVVNYSAPESMDLCSNVGSVVFNYIGAEQSWTVPTGVTEVNIVALGAQGGGAYGYGGKAEGTLSVTPGEQLYIRVGGKGLMGSAADGGFNGGGNSGVLPSGMSDPSGSGGGASDVRKGGQSLSDRVIVAGGGGGTTAWSNQGAGGAGGGLSGLQGTQSPLAGLGGDQSAGGVGFSPGTLGQGGAGEEGLLPYGVPGAGGGGGYYGGGSGKRSDANNGGYPGGGGGGSSYIGGVTNGTTTAGTNSGHGKVTISWGGASVLTTSLIAGLGSGAYFPVGTTIEKYLLTNENTGDTASCSFSITVMIDTSTSVINNTITSNQTNSSYQWLDCNNNYAIIPGETNQSFTASQNGNYAVQVGANGCIDTSACVAITTVGINGYGYVGNNKVTFFPNPTNGILKTRLPRSNNDYTIEVYSVTGKLVKRLTNQKEGNAQLDLSGNKGMFFIKIKQDEDIIAYEKVLIIE